MLTSYLSKFFGQPNGSKPPPTQQTKLSFATKSTKKPKDEPQSSATEAKTEETAEEGRASSPGTLYLRLIIHHLLYFLEEST